MLVVKARNLINMVGWEGAGCRVLREAASTSREARWLALSLLPECGHEFLVDGWKLRKAEKDKRTLLCPACAKRRHADSTAATARRRSAAHVPMKAPHKAKRSAKHGCEDCEGMPWRVVGGVCKCGLVFAEEKVARG